MKQKYNDEFRQMIVELYRSGRSVSELSTEYGVSDVTIYKWIKKYFPIAIVEDTEITPEDLKRMQKEMLRLKEENEILKKAMAIFARK
jgi:transposase